MEVLEEDYSVIHDILTGASSYSSEDVLDEVGAYLDDKVRSMRERGEVVEGALDAVLGEAIEPRFNRPKDVFRPNEGTEVWVDVKNGIFKFKANPDRRYWIPYIEGQEACIFTDSFEQRSGNWEPIRFAYDGNDEKDFERPHIDEETNLDRPEMSEDAEIIYDILGELAPRWGASLFSDKLEVEKGETTTADYSNIHDQLLEMRNNGKSEVAQETMAELKKISENPDRYEKIIDGFRIYKPNRVYRLAGNLKQNGEIVYISKFGHRSNFYSESVGH
jgi:hypothetical protein